MRWLVPALALGGLAASAALVVVVDRTPTQAADAGPQPPTLVHVRRGTVNPHDGARFSLISQPPDEIVRLREGVIDVDVEPLHDGERFRVVVGVDEVEVHGTSFRVVAAGDRIASVTVVHGRVSLRRHDASGPVLLTTGEAWSAPVSVAPAPIAPTVVAPHPKVTTGTIRAVASSKPSAKPPDPQELAFDAGWDAMRRDDLGTASAAFARAIALAPDGPLAEDASFWRAVALAKLDRSAEAIAAFHGFLDAYPSSTRVGEASAMLGWMLFERGELDEARRRFRAAEHDPHPTAQQSARRGLDAIDKLH